MFKKSLKNRLVIILLLVFISLWSVVFTWLYIDLKQRLNDTLDQRLSASAHMVVRLIQQLPLHELNASLLQDTRATDDEHLIACEVSLFSSDISVGQYTLAKTRGAPNDLSEQAIGFTTWTQNEVMWRSYVLRKGDFQVVAAERMFLRNSLLQQIIQSVLIPLILSLLLCIGLIIFIIRKEFLALDEISQHLNNHDLSLTDLTEYLRNIDPKSIPEEVKPFVDNTVLLIQRLSQSLEQEKAFSAYAAHELRSPLTAIKMNVQLASLVAKTQQASVALQEHLERADHNIRRYGELLKQLLLLTQSEHGTIQHVSPTIISTTLKEVMTVLEQHYPQIKTVLQVNWQSLGSLNVPPWVLFSTLKNLIENSLIHAQATHIYLDMQAGQLVMTDNGKTLKSEDIIHLGQRFWRKSSNHPGHGLGLALTDAFLKQYGYQLKFDLNQMQGLQVSIQAL